MKTAIPKKEAPKWMVITFLAFIGLIFFLLIRSCANGGSSDALSGNDSTRYAYIIAKQFVKNSLKSPSSAEFPTGEYTAYRNDSGIIVINSYVDAQNSFGAKLRTNYTAALKWNGKEWANAKNWELIYLNLK